MLIPLTLPALFAAGLGSSAHCALMCSAVGARASPVGSTSRFALLQLHAGRITGYALLGAAAAGLAGGVLRVLPAERYGNWVQLAAALSLVTAGALQLRKQKPECCARPPAASPRLPASAAMFARGLLWAAMPCAILYGVLAIAAFSANAITGAALLAAFGLGTLPALLLGNGILRWNLGPGARGASGAILLVLGLLEAGAILLHQSAPLAWCAGWLT